VVTDPENHVLRMVDGEGRVTTLGGEPGQAGHRDSPVVPLAGIRQVPLFRGPTHVAVQRLPARGFQPCWRAYVADSGNHVIRQVDPDGRVETLAGCSGIAGHADHDDPRLALFRDPQGVCVVDGNLYVADRGNHVIRKTGKAEVVLRLVTGQGISAGIRRTVEVQ
jgi:hypothetical protein